ncbi:MAG: tripartite tricarboxylate transporter permease [Bacilli bacterium]|nr:tripartite tricarboxylate transporter permease [Bacilli bacterium]
MVISLTLILQMLGIALLMTILYVIIGIIPGTDETSVLVPMTVILVSLKLDPLLIMTGFIAAVVTLNITDSIPTAITSIPGGVMSTPLVGPSQTLKKHGYTSYSVQWMMIGSLIGVLVSLPIALAFWGIFEFISVQTGMQVSNFIKQYNEYIFLGGAILMSMTSKKKWVGLLTIIPFGFATAFLRNPSLVIEGTLLNFLVAGRKLSMTPFFLSITTGPLVYGLFELLFPSVFKKQKVEGKMTVLLEQDIKKVKTGTKKVVRKTAISSALGSLLFFLSPVGVTMMLGEFATRDEKDEVQQAIQGVAVVNGISSATYLAGILISLFVFAFPISPAALGPGSVIFNAGANGVDGTFIQFGNSGLTLPKGNLLVAIIIGIVVGVSISVFLGMKYSRKMTELVFKYIAQETVLIFLFSIIALLSFAEAGVYGLIIVLAVGLFSGWLNKKGAGYGVQFMALYAGGLFITLLKALF